MKKLLIFIWLVVMASPAARAWTYDRGDVILVFRKPGFDNILFNIGSVTQFVGKPAGYQANISNFNIGLVTSTFGNDLSGDVRFALVATTSLSDGNRRAWLSASDTNTVPLDRTGTQWQLLWSKIDAVGTKPEPYTQTSAVPSYVVSPSHISSYDYINSSGGGQPGLIPTLGGASVFAVEQAIPGFVAFYEVKPSTVSPKPEASRLGSFVIDANGTLTFRAGNPAPATSPGIVRIERVGATNIVTFTTTIGGNYRLRFTNTLGGPANTWQVVGGTVTGTGANRSLEDTNSGSNGFYAVERNP